MIRKNCGQKNNPFFHSGSPETRDRRSWGSPSNHHSYSFFQYLVSRVICWAILPSRLLPINIESICNLTHLVITLFVILVDHHSIDHQSLRICSPLLFIGLTIMYKQTLMIYLRIRIEKRKNNDWWSIMLVGCRDNIYLFWTAHKEKEIGSRACKILFFSVKDGPTTLQGFEMPLRFSATIAVAMLMNLLGLGMMMVWYATSMQCCWLWLFAVLHDLKCL